MTDIRLNPENSGPIIASILSDSRAFLPKCVLRKLKKSDYSKRLRERLRAARAEQRGEE